MGWIIFGIAMILLAVKFVDNARIAMKSGPYVETIERKTISIDQDSFFSLN